MFAEIALAAGWAGVLAEFLRPGRVIPGVVGAVAVMVALARMLPEHVWAAAGVTAPFAVAAGWLSVVAWRARRNKTR